MLFFVGILNIFYRFNLPIPIGAIFWFERRLWNDPLKIKEFLMRVDPGLLWKIAEKKLIHFSNIAFVSTPALRQIQTQSFSGKRIRTIKQFKEHVPMLDKDSYRKPFSLQELCRNGALPRAGGFYTSAGTSGKPTLWIESIEEEDVFDAVVSFIGDIMLDVRRKSYTIVNCWALGSWPTGIDFAVGARREGRVINAGTNLSEAISIILLAGPGDYLLTGYPPFIFHFFNECEKAGISLAEYRFSIVTGGEGFPEEWRDSLIKKIGHERAIFSVYGSTDKGLGEGIETNLAYLVRSLIYIASVILNNEARAREIGKLRFSASQPIFTPDTARAFLLDIFKREEHIYRNPMVFQFDPTRYYNENIVTVDPVDHREIEEFITTVIAPETAIPRIRYNIHDEGFVMTYDDLVAVLRKHNIDINTYNPRSDRFLDLHLPFLFLYGRSDGTISLDGSNIFPEDIASCLDSSEMFQKIVRSFQLFVTETYNFGVAIELVEGERPTESLKSEFEAHLQKNLEHTSYGYKEIVRDRLKSAKISVELYAAYEGPFAKNLIKFKYVKR